MTDRQRMFDYLDGVADGLNESRNDVADVLEQIRAEIEQMETLVTKFEVLDLIDKHIKGVSE